MANPRVNGTNAAILQPVTVDYDPTRGVIYDFAYEAAGPPGQTNIESIASTMLSNRIPYKIQDNPRRARIDVKASSSQLGYPDLQVDEWQVLSNEVQKDIREHPWALYTEGVYPGTIGWVTDAITTYNNGGGSPTFSGAPDAAATPLTPNNGSSAITISQFLFSLMVHNFPAMFSVPQYVVRHSTNCSNAWTSATMNLLESNINCIYSTAKLITECTTGWTFPMPSALQTVVTNAAANTPYAYNTTPGYLWGWRKLSTQRNTTAMNRIAVSVEYWLDFWGCPIPYAPNV